MSYFYYLRNVSSSTQRYACFWILRIFVIFDVPSTRNQQPIWVHSKCCHNFDRSISFFTEVERIMVVLGVREDFGKAGHDHNLFLQYLPLMAIPTFIIINIFTFIKRGKSWKDVFRVQRVLESLEISGTNNKVHHERDSTINGWDEQKD
nr:unnamed protein product [Haemonchus contortus]